MKLSISNLAFAATDSIQSILHSIDSYNISGLEIAPSRLFTQIGSDHANKIVDFRKRLETHNVRVSGIQSLLFGRPELQLFDKTCWPSLYEELRKSIQFAVSLNASIIVFGAPKNRVKSNLTTSEANQFAAEFFDGISDELRDNQVILSLEPNAKEYGADWITTFEEALEFTQLFSSIWIQPQIDTGSMFMSGEDLVGAFNAHTPCHIHISEPSLCPPPIMVNHDSFATAISRSEYSGWIVLEMLYQPGVPIESTLNVIKWFQINYRNKLPHG